jgi:serine phosphatase RsbU (regulator of sigma subunit)
MYEIRCAEVWGGIRGEDIDADVSAINVSLFSKAADGERGGDIYYVSRCENDAITRVAVADVRGHGEAVRDISCWFYEALQARMNEPDDAAVLADLNDLVATRGLEAMTTAVVVSFDRGTSTLRFAYAGHYPAYALSRSSRRWDRVALKASQAGTNLPLGAFHGTSYELGEVSFSVCDRLFLYTDGLIEAPSPTREGFGLQRLVDVLEQGRDLSARGIKALVHDALCKHTAGDLTHDDVTFLVVEPRSFPSC